MVCYFSLLISICAVMTDLGRIMGQLKLNNSLSSVVEHLTAAYGRLNDFYIKAYHYDASADQIFVL